MQHAAFKHIYLTAHDPEQKMSSTLIKLNNYLLKRDIRVTVSDNLIQTLDTSSFAPRNSLPNSVDLIIVVGGDGSMLHAAQTAIHYDLPIIGVHRGHLGFLNDIAPDEFSALEPILNGHYLEQPRNLLQTQFTTADNNLQQENALNDAVILPGDSIHMIEFDVLINQQLVSQYRANGLIVATPTGSTAYSLSAGGPILHPTLEAMILVPMFSHTLGSRPIIIKSDSKIEIVVHKKNKFSPFLTCDGRTKSPLKIESSLHIETHPKSLRLIHPTDYHFYNRLREKLGWERRYDRI